MKILQKNIAFLTKADTATILAKHTASGGEDEETIKYLVTEYCKDSPHRDAAKSKLLAQKLFPFEVYQLLDARPMSLLTLQLIVDDMEERYTEEQLIAILEMLREKE